MRSRVVFGGSRDPVDGARGLPRPKTLALGPPHTDRVVLIGSSGRGSRLDVAGETLAGAMPRTRFALFGLSCTLSATRRLIDHVSV
jgi:hypothetical protein